MKKMLAVLLAAGVLLTVSACSRQQDEVSEANVDAVSDAVEESDNTGEEVEATEISAEGTEENPVIEAIQNRHSTARDDFTGKEIDEDVLKLLGWAATGTNRGGEGFVVPLAMGSDPFVSLYLAQESGVRRYSWEIEDFEYVSDLDIRSQATMIDLSETVTAIWIFVIEADQVPNENLTWAYHAIGAMSGHQYLVAEEFGVQARYMAAVEADNVSELLELSENQLPVGVMMMAQK